MAVSFPYEFSRITAAATLLITWSFSFTPSANVALVSVAALFPGSKDTGHMDGRRFHRGVHHHSIMLNRYRDAFSSKFLTEDPFPVLPIAPQAFTKRWPAPLGLIYPICQIQILRKLSAHRKIPVKDRPLAGRAVRCVKHGGERLSRSSSRGPPHDGPRYGCGTPTHRRAG